MHRSAVFALFGCGLLAAGAARAAEMAYRFTAGAAQGPGVLVGSRTAYSAQRGYGFDLGTDYSTERPYFFSASVPEGTYAVTVTLGDPSVPTVTTVKAEARRLMLEAVRTQAGRLVERTFLVNVRTPALGGAGDAKAGRVSLNPRELGSLDWDDKLTLEIDGPHSGLAALSIAPAGRVTTVILAGDSTVTDQPIEPWASWGQMLPRFFGPQVCVANHAESGETLKAFVYQRRLDKILRTVGRGDYLFIQFGHNDMKRFPATYVDAFTTYKAWLRVYVAEARLRGAIPVLVTSMNRRTFDAQGKVTNSLGNYPEAVRQVSREDDVPLIDLNAMSKKLYEAWGPSGSGKAFVDGTHHDDYGAYELAKCVCEGIREARLGLAEDLTADFKGFDPGQPDPLATFDVPASPGRDPQAPLGN